MDTAIRVWDGSGWHGLAGLRKLQNRCLVDVVEGPRDAMNPYLKKQYLIIHDNVRALGRVLAEEEPDLGGHRLWQPTENLLHNNLADQSAVRGLVCNTIEQRLSLGQSNRSISWSRLELLMTRGYYLEDILRSVQSPEHLIWLHCDDFPFPDLPRWIPMDRLSVLNVQGYNLRGLWGDQAPLQLWQLDIAAPLSKFPKSIGLLEYLEKIVLRKPHSTKEVPLKILPDEFCYLRRLQHLELNDCSEMESLPESFGNLENLEHLQLSSWSKLRELPNSFGKLIRLKLLCLYGCISLIMSCETLGNITTLEFLDMTSCNKIEVLLLCLYGCISLIMSCETLGNITTLEFLDMTSCNKIEVLPRQVAHQLNLSQLLISDTSIRELPSAAIEDLTALEILEIGGRSLERLPDRLGCLKNLKELIIWDSDKIKCLPDSIGELTQLQNLTLCTGVECLPPWIMALSKLVKLEVSTCHLSSLRELPFNRAGRERETRSESTDCLLGLKDFFLMWTRISEVVFGKGVCPVLQRLHISFCNLLVEVGTLPDSLIN